MSVYSKCVFTIVHSQILDDIISGRDVRLITINRPWVSAQKDFIKAKENGEDFYCVIAPAEDTTYLSAFGIVEDIIVDGANQKTDCIFSEVHYFSKRNIPKTSIHVVSTGEKLSEGYIRPYTICETETLKFQFSKYQDYIKPFYVKSKNIKEIWTQVYSRDPRVKINVQNRAGNKCELCNQKAAFIKTNDEPYFELHHLIPLAEGGSDSEDNAVLLCPNCHRELHYGKEGKKKAEQLLKKLKG